MSAMRYIVDIPAEIADEINRLIQSGKYRNIQDFIAAAASNQLQIERVAIEGFVVESGASIGRVTSETHAQRSDKFQFQLLSPDFGNIQTVPPPDPAQVSQELYGLWNRFFPIKITVRVLANILKGDGTQIPLDSSQERAAEVARQLGRAIVRKERDLGRKRGEMIATALPWKREEFKAKTRFKTHFVGYLSKNKMEGAPATLRFVNITKSDGTVVIGITAAGLKFATLTNPVIDQEDYSSSLSAPERDFLLDHIRVELPAESNLMKNTLVSIAGGASNPSTLHAKFVELKTNLNETELLTLRAGLLSRMYELNLINRKRNGLAISYSVTDDGRKFMEE